MFRFIGNTSNQFPIINSRHYLEIRTPLPTLVVKQIGRYYNAQQEEMILIVTATHIHPYHAATGMKVSLFSPFVVCASLF